MRLSTEGGYKKFLLLYQTARPHFSEVVVVCLQIRKGDYIQNSNTTWVFLDRLAQQSKKDAYEMLLKATKTEKSRANKFSDNYRTSMRKN